MNSSQLELDLFPGQPWRGCSPRALTRGRLGVIFKAQDVKSVSDFVDPAQLSFAFIETGAPWKYQGAPLLKEVQHG